MQSFESYYFCVVEILKEVDEHAALALLGMSGEAELVTLLEGQTTAAEALSYARMMFEIGMDEVAHDVVREVMSASISVPTFAAQGSYAIA
ncbi:MAG: hypothetical protein H6737_13670 [Alphaproteobacteria bacterium]|nr:hypothetical protein [Alphaproteobacteria bacterium]